MKLCYNMLYMYIISLYIQLKHTDTVQFSSDNFNEFHVLPEIMCTVIQKL